MKYTDLGILKDILFYLANVWMLSDITQSKMSHNPTERVVILPRCRWSFDFMLPLIKDFDQDVTLDQPVPNYSVSWFLKMNWLSCLLFNDNDPAITESLCRGVSLFKISTSSAMIQKTLNQLLNLEDNMSRIYREAIEPKLVTMASSEGTTRPLNIHGK